MKRRLDVMEFSQDLRLGLTDEQLMEKYNLSENALKDLFERIARAMACGSSQIEVNDESEP